MELEVLNSLFSTSCLFQCCSTLIFNMKTFCIEHAFCVESHCINNVRATRKRLIIVVKDVFIVCVFLFLLQHPSEVIPKRKGDCDSFVSSGCSQKRSAFILIADCLVAFLLFSWLLFYCFKILNLSLFQRPSLTLTDGHFIASSTPASQTLFRRFM